MTGTPPPASAARSPAVVGAPQTPARARVVGAFLALYLIWGSTYLFIRWLVADIPPFLAGAMRHGAAGAVLYAWSRRHGAPRPTRRQWGVAALVGFMLLGFGNGMVNWAETRTPSGLTSLIVSSVPIWFVTIEWLRPHGIRPSRRTAAGLALGTAGIIGLVWSAGGIGAHAGARATIVVSCIALVLGSLSWAGGSVVSRQLRRHPHGSLATSMEMLTASAALFFVSWWTGDIAAFDPARVSTLGWLSLAYLVVFGSIVGFSAYTWLLRVSTPSKVATYAYVNPIIAVALGWAFAGEHLTWGTFGAAALLLGAVVLITLPPRLRRRAAAQAVRDGQALR